MELKIGDKIKIGKKYAELHNFKKDEVITLVEGEFEEYNGLYCYMSYAPSIWNKNVQEFDSIFHLFGNDLEDFMDCIII